MTHNHVVPSYLTEFQNNQKLCQLLMETPHYQKIGAAGILAIIETARALDIDPRQALNGGMYYVKGKVEMSSRMMAMLIRSKKHSITRDSKSDDTICILHGKRADSGDCWTESFSIKEADKAGLLKNDVWRLFPRDMLYARALSRLARQLFPDVIGNCYVEGELSLDSNIQEKDAVTLQVANEEQRESLVPLLDKVPSYKEQVLSFLERKGISKLEEMPLEMHEKILKRTKEKISDEEKGE